MDGPDLTDKVAVVTGGSRGIGRAIADAFATAGADVVIASRKLDNCVAVADGIAERTGRRTLPVATHVGKWDDCDRLADTVLEHFGRCDVLVNNAGMSPLYPDLLSITEEYYDKVASVNLKGPFRLGARFGSHMAANDGGVDHQHLDDGIDPSRAAGARLRLRQVRAQRPDDRAGRRLRAEGAQQRHPPRRRS